MAALSYIKPSVFQLPPGGDYLPQNPVFPQPGAIFRRSDFLIQATTGSITNPSPAGTLVTITPTAAPTFSTTTSAGAPAQQLYGFYTYTSASNANESQPSAEFVIDVPAGKEATVTIPSAGEPSNVSHVNLYVGVLPGGEWQQIANHATGSAMTIPYPLTNSSGANRAATNQAGSIIGYSVNDFDVTFAPLAGSPGVSYGNRALFGNDQSWQGVGFEQYQNYYINPAGLTFVMSLVQPWYSSLLQTTCGLLYSTTYDCFAADNSQGNAILTIVGKYGQVNSNPSFNPVGGAGDTGALVLVQFNSGLLA